MAAALRSENSDAAAEKPARGAHRVRPAVPHMALWALSSDASSQFTSALTACRLVLMKPALGARKQSFGTLYGRVIRPGTRVTQKRYLPGPPRAGPRQFARHKTNGVTEAFRSLTRRPLVLIRGRGHLNGVAQPCMHHAPSRGRCRASVGRRRTDMNPSISRAATLSDRCLTSLDSVRDHSS